MSTREFMDWRGNSYTVGTTVLYPRMCGRSCEISEGTVTDLWYAFRDWDEEKGYVWKRWDGIEDKPENSETRVKIQPNGRGSRNFYRSDSECVYGTDDRLIFDENNLVVTKPLPIKPVTLTVTENVTVIEKVAA